MVRALVELVPDTLSDASEPVKELYRAVLFFKAVLATTETHHLPSTDSEWVETLKAVLVNGFQDFGGAADSLGLSDMDDLKDKLPQYLARVTTVRDRFQAAHTALVQLQDLGPVAVDRAQQGIEAHRRRIACVLVNVAEAFRAALGNLESDPTLDRALSTVSRVVIDVRTGDYAAAVGAFTTLVRDLGADSLLPDAAARLLAFAADVSQSSTPDDIKKSIRSLAAAAASRRNKRAADHEWLVALQAYGGVQTGRESVNSDEAWFGGLYAPVGFEVTPKKWQVGLFVQIIDVGVIASSRIAWSTDNVDSSPEVGFRQIVAPGAYLTYAFRNTPLSFGAGGSLAPRLLSLETGEERDAFRLGVFLAVDIPIFP